MFYLAEKGDVARTLADSHRKYEPTISRIVRVVATADKEQGPHEPVKLLEVNPATSPSGIVPIAFGPDPPQIPYPSIVIEVTEGEFEKIREGLLQLPDGWSLGDTLYLRAA